MSGAFRMPSPSNRDFVDLYERIHGRTTEALYAAIGGSGPAPKLHPHGFLQLDLGGDRSERLHVWADDIPRTADANTLHDHTWDFRSTVLKGELMNAHYVTVPDPKGDWELWQATDDRHEGERGGKVLTPTGKLYHVPLNLVDHTRITLGKTYAYPAFCFHDSAAVGTTITYFQKTRIYHYNEKPRILCRVGYRPDGEPPAEVTIQWMIERIAGAFDA